MPCYAVRMAVQTVDNIPDIKILGGALEEMGFKVQINNKALAFSGVDKTTGIYQSGTFQNGKLKSQEGLDLAMVKKYAAVANIKSQIQKNNGDKYKKIKLTLNQTGPFSFKVIKT